MGLKNNLKIFFILQISMGATFAQQLITLDKGGNVGVNFGGFSAGAGLGGLLNGNAANGGLHAYARTPFGQNAAAGLGGNIQNDGTSTGGLFANAEAGGGVGAGAGLGGTVSNTKTVVSSESEAVAVPVYKYVTKQVQVPAASSLEINKEIVVDKPAPEPQHVMVIPPTVETPVYIEKTVYKNRRPHLRRKYAYVNARVNSGEVYAPPPPQVVKVVNVEKTYQPIQPVQPLPLDTNYTAANRYVANVSVNKNGNLFNDIFNIPISTLKAVSQLVNNIVGGVTVSKEVVAHGHVDTGAAVNVHKEKTVY